MVLAADADGRSCGRRRRAATGAFCEDNFKGVQGRVLAAVALAQAVGGLRQVSWCTMKVILSHPYVGPIYWWFDQERQYAHPKKPGHPYYAALFGDVDRHLDVALACALIYEEFIVPAADAVHPGMGDMRHFSPADLGLEVSEWDPIHEAHRLSEHVRADWQADPVLAKLLAGKPESEVGLELHYAVADVLLAAAYNAPVLCSNGRRAVVRRLIELGVVPAHPGVAAAFSSDKSVTEMVDSYAKVAGLTFGADSLSDFADLKWMSPLREYADGFQRALDEPSTRSTDDLYEAIAKALETEALAKRVQGAFDATGHVMDLVGLVPGIGTVTGLIGLGSNAAAHAAEKQAARVRWFELSDAVAGVRRRSALEAELDARGFR